MSTLTTTTRSGLYDPLYPSDDGEPMAENTKQFNWIVTIKEGLETVFLHRPDVFVAGDLLWYPVEGQPTIRTAPDAMVAFGRPKGDRGCYKQWEEGGIAPQVVFEVLSPGNRPGKMAQKFAFYEQYGVEEYYIYDPDHNELEGWTRLAGRLQPIAVMNNWTSPRLGVRFVLTADTLELYGPDGERFLTFAERVEAQRLAEQEARRAQQEARNAEDEVRRAEQRARALEFQLRALGIEPQV
jgi:Uma2 family endonuclease